VRRLRCHLGSPMAWVATAVFVGVMVLWTIVTPGFRNPDEPQHVNSVLRIAEGGGWPAPAEAYMAPEVLRAKTLTGFSAIDGQQGPWAGGTLLPGIRPGIPEADLMYYALFSHQVPTPPGERLPFSELQLAPGVDLSQHGDQMTQHPPLYYGLSGTVVWATGALDWRFDRALALMRLVDVALVAPLPLMIFTVVRRITGRRRLADAASFLPIAIPQLGALGGSVSNDALVIALGGLLTVFLARILTGDRSMRTLLAAAGVLGLALLTKGTMLAAVPVAGLAVAVGARRIPPMPWKSTVLRLAVLWVPAFAIGGWWWVLNYVRYGTLQPAGVPEDGLARLVSDRQRFSVWEFAEVFWQKITATFWGTFGQLELPLPGALVLTATVVLLVSVALSLRQRESRTPLLVLLSFLALMIVALFATTYLSHLANGRFAGIQGRYLYGGLVALLAAVAVGVGGWSRPSGRFERCLTPLVSLGVAGLAAYGLSVAFHGYYVDSGWSVEAAWQRMIDWSPWPAWSINGLLVGLVGLVLAAFALSVVSALRPGGDGNGDHGDEDRPVSEDAVDTVEGDRSAHGAGQPWQGDPTPATGR
jgi:4-amino-4-deoxy-L-arabinose transferase-like glycosyltransferase